MPRDSNGNYSLPAGYLAVTGQTVEASQHNPPLEDLASSMTASLPRNGAAPMLGNLPFGGFKGVNLAPGTASTDAVNKAQLDGAMPIGAVIPFAGATAPSNWLLCYGQAVSRTTYAALFAVIGTTYGAGDGSTTFNVPDANGRVIAGKDNMGGTDKGRLSAFFGGVARTLGGILGAASHILTIAQMPGHTHSVTGTALSSGAHDHRLTTGAGGGGTTTAVSRDATSSQTGGNTAVQVDGAHTHAVSGTALSAGGSDAHPNAQPTLIMNVIIKAA